MMERNFNREHLDPENGGTKEDGHFVGNPEVSPLEFRPPEGTWRNGAYHLATTIATPAAFAPLPFAIAALGWEAGVITLVMGTMVTSYCSYLLASLWDYEGTGKRNVSYGALANSIFGLKGYWSVVTFQQIASLGNNITIQIVAGVSMKAVYKTYHPNGNLTLQDFIIIFGVLELLLSQLPDIHSLRQLNLLCTICTVGFSATAVAMSIYDGKDLRKSNSTAPPVKYGLGGLSSSAKVYGIFNALGTIAFSFGDAMLPEIQATMRKPPKANMYKGIALAYSLIAVTYWLVAFVGYWAFGQGVDVFLVNSFTHPNWAITLAYIFAVIQVAGCYQIYCRPTYVYVEFKLLDHSKGIYSLRNAIIRLGITSVYMVLVTLVAAAVPFFGDFVALCGAIGFTPLDFIIPILAFLVVRRPKNKLVLCLNVTIISLYSVVAVLGCIGAIKAISENVKKYHFFKDL